MAKKKTYTPKGPMSAFNAGKGWGAPTPAKPAKPVYGWGQSNPGIAAGVNAAQAGAPNMTPDPVTGQWVPTSSVPNVGGPPLDPQAEAARISGGRNLAIANADASYSTGVAEQTFGYGASGAANPYSRAALLQESFTRAKRGTLNSAGNQLYSGAYGRAQDENARNYSIAEDANRRAYDSAIYGINRGKASAAANYGTGMSDEDFNALLRALGVG